MKKWETVVTHEKQLAIQKQEEIEIASRKERQDALEVISEPAKQQITERMFYYRVCFNYKWLSIERKEKLRNQYCQMKN